MANLTFSEVAYLFADQLITDRARFANLDDHPSGEKIPVAKLAQLMVRAAVIDLVKQKMIELEVKTVKKMWLFSAQEVIARRLKDSDRVTGIEARLLSQINTETNLRKAAYNLLPADESSPWGQVIVLSKQSLLAKKVLVLEEKARLFRVKRFFFAPQVPAQYDKEYVELKHDLATQIQDAQLSALVDKAIKAGIGARQEVEMNDD